MIAEETTKVTQDFLLTDEEDTDYIGFRNKQLAKWYSGERFGLHVSDALCCPRQHVFKSLEPIPLTQEEIERFSLGKAIHNSFETTLSCYDPGRFKKEHYVTYMGITGTIDLYDAKNNIPIELKSTRQVNVTEPKSFQVQQLKWYMALVNSRTGFLIYYMQNMVRTPLKQFKIEMTQIELDEERYNLVKEMKAIKTAIKAKDPSLAKGIWADEDLNWLCKSCPYAVECEKMR